MVNPFLRSFVQGAFATCGSTAIACGLAIQVEKSAHRLLFRLAPHKYANVEQAYGLTEEQLLSVRTGRPTQTTNTTARQRIATTEEPELLPTNATIATATPTTDTTTTLASFGLATPLSSTNFIVNRSDGEAMLTM